MSFGTAQENLYAAARHGLEARLYWPGMGEVPAAELILRRLLPLAYEGLTQWGVDSGSRDRLLGIIERRCVTGRTGASWQIDTVTAMGDLDRHEALRRMTLLYLEHMHSNEPVSSW
jgi:hypothetical protein